mgnify:CR=1 FL=1
MESGEAYCSNVQFEQKQSRTNRLIVNVRYPTEEDVGESYFFLKQDVTVPTYAFDRAKEKDRKKIFNVVPI